MGNELLPFLQELAALEAAHRLAYERWFRITTVLGWLPLVFSVGSLAWEPLNWLALATLAVWIPAFVRWRFCAERWLGGKERILTEWGRKLAGERTQ